MNNNDMKTKNKNNNNKTQKNNKNHNNITKLLTENMFAKHIVLILLIYFTVDLTSETVSHPMDTLKSTFELWVFYLLFTKLDMTFTMINDSADNICPSPKNIFDY